MRAFVTGGAGFIGSHIVDELVRRNYEVIVYDNLSTGFQGHLRSGPATNGAKLIVGDILDYETLVRSMKDADLVVHLAANADVRGGKSNTRVDLKQNVIGTHNVLEALRINHVPEIVFTSSATVYGEPDVFPTPETYAPLQTSIYGASKLAAEAMIQAYSEYFGVRSYMFRFVSWIGERYSHGVVYDFVKKLKANPKELEILGDGNQRKSYLYVKDGVEGIFLALRNIRGLKNVLNLGHEDIMNVTRLASIVVEEMGLKDVKFQYTGGERGWLGDSPFVHLDISKIVLAGFKPQTTIEEGIRRTTRYLLENEWLLNSRPMGITG
ncbi:MAG: NAD-dependent epimerase/dehydratase family protein [Desulfomonilaceae bacterium]